MKAYLKPSSLSSAVYPIASRVGPRMARVVEVVRDNPGCPKIIPARAVAPSRHGRIGLHFGYKSVNRAIRAGLITAERLPSGTYALNVRDGLVIE
jgi:hypothetical protein